MSFSISSGEQKQEYHDQGEKVKENEMPFDKDAVVVSDCDSISDGSLGSSSCVIINDDGIDNSINNNNGDVEIGNLKETKKIKESETETKEESEDEIKNENKNKTIIIKAEAEKETEKETETQTENNRDHDKIKDLKDLKDLKESELIDQLPKFVQGLLNNSSNIDTQVECCRSIRKISSIGKDPPFDELIESGIVPHLIEYLKMDWKNNIEHVVTLQIEAGWILTNICSGTPKHVKFVVSHGAIKPLVDLILSPNKDVSSQAVWALGNIAGDSPQHRDMVLSNGVLSNLRILQNGCIDELNAKYVNGGGGELEWKAEQFKQLLKDSNCLKSIKLLRNMSWTVNNLCRGSPSPDSKYIKDAVEILNEMFQLPDNEILQDVGWGFSSLTDPCARMTVDTNDAKEFDEKFPLIKESGALKKLIECLNHDEYDVRLPMLRALGNLVTGGDEQTQDVINMGLCDKLAALLDLKQSAVSDRNESTFLKETCWMISNITAGTEEQIDCVMKNDIFPSLINLLKNGPCEVRKEAAWAISNATSGGNKAQIRYLVHRGVIEALVSSLESIYPKILLIAMEGLNNILSCGEDIKNETESDENEFSILVESAGGLNKVEYLV